MAEGRLIYLMGPSGCGKDSLMRYARSLLSGEPRLLFAHRYITRPADHRGENHVALDDAEFEARLRAGLFAMHWESHGYRYGIGREIDLWLAAGFRVAVNGSRAYLAAALERYPTLCPVLVEAPPEVLAARLRSRGREAGEQLAARLERAARFRPVHPRLRVLDNHGPLEVAGRRLAALLKGEQEGAGCA